MRMPRLLILLLMIVSFTNTRAAEVTLAENGRAAMPIVIAPAASESTKAVAKELAGYLQRVTGAAFEVTTGDGRGGGIVLGTLAEFPDEALARPLEIRKGVDGREAYAIRAEG